jgi:lysozyme
MNAIEIASDLCKIFEGFRSRPYLCPANVWTIGYGTTRYENGTRVKPTDPAIGKGTALLLLQTELVRCETAVIRYCPILEDDVRKRAAIIDFVYNLGAGRLQASTLRRKINNQDWEGTKKELTKWVNGGGRKLPGLVKRRAAEIKLF